MKLFCTRFNWVVLVWMLGGLSVEVLAMEQDLREFMSSPATFGLQVYKRYISPAKGSSCPMEPSDSTYSTQAIARHGLWRGALMTADRLHRCGHDTEHYAIVRTSRGLKFYDPVDPISSNP